MTKQRAPHDFAPLNEQAREAWNINADFWNERMGEGNDFHRLLIEPAQLRLLELRPGELVLDIACGNGQFARKLAQLGADVFACDFSERMIENAKARTTQNAERIQYSVLDATDRGQLMALGERRFDAAVCTMALMDMASIEPLFSSLSRLLKAEGRFVFSVSHPCFNSINRLAWIVEREERDGEVVDRYFMKISGYSQPEAYRGTAMIGQPVPHTYFHRPISLLFNACFAEGFVLDGIEEPVFDLPLRPDSPFAWENFREIPPVLSARMRLVK